MFKGFTLCVFGGGGGHTATDSVSVSFKNTDPVALFCAISPLVIDYPDACRQPRPCCDNGKEQCGAGGGGGGGHGHQEPL